MTPLRKRTIEYMTLKGYSLHTQRTYLQHLQSFALHFGCCPSKLDDGHIKTYLHHLVAERELSKSTLNAAYSALKLLFVNILDRPWSGLKLPRPKRLKTLPVVLSRQEVQLIFDALDNAKHRTLLMLIYCGGLRVSEAVCMWAEDIDSRRMLIRIRQGKGHKDRYTILSAVMLEQLRHYWRLYRPQGPWLFTGYHPNEHLSIRTAQTVYAQAKGRAGVRKRGGVHQLRHCFATHLIEDGVDVTKVQFLLGHAHLSTTARYLHLSPGGFSGIEHPMDKPSGE